MKYFHADSFDTISERYNFIDEEHHETRKNRGDDVYPHEIGIKTYQGILVSRHTLEKYYSSYFLDNKDLKSLMRWDSEIIVDSGAFSYINKDKPPFKTKEMISFYESTNCDYGVAIDHIPIKAADLYKVDFYKKKKLFYKKKNKIDKEKEMDDKLKKIKEIIKDNKRRVKITIKNAKKFLRECKRLKVSFTPIATIQGWDAKSYKKCAKKMFMMGYDYLAIGGIVKFSAQPDKLIEILDAIHSENKNNIPLHLFGVIPINKIHTSLLSKYNIVSYDSASPIQQAFKDKYTNYWFDDYSYTAIRVPKITGGSNTKIDKEINEGNISFQNADSLQQEALKALRSLDTNNPLPDSQVLQKLKDYHKVCGLEVEGRDLKELEKTVKDKPWLKCSCPRCKTIGVETIIFRDNTRNKSRGFHNIYQLKKNYDKWVKECEDEKD